MNELEIDDDDIAFTQENARIFYRAHFDDPQLIERWERINLKVKLQDVIADLHHGESREVFSCPFHGRDSRPSFKVYPAKNNAWCFGCPDQSNYYDAVRFVSAKFDYGRLQAIIWLEKKYHLPPLEKSLDEEDEEGLEKSGQRVLSLKFEDLEDPYITAVAAAFAANPDPWMVRGLIQTFFDALPAGPPEAPEEIVKLQTLGRVLGQKALDAIKRVRFGVGATL